MRLWLALVVAGALCAGTHVSLVAPTLASQGAPSGRNSVSPCHAAQLQLRPQWTGGAGSVEGQITVTNRSDEACVVTAEPPVGIVAGGTRLAVTVSHAAVGPSGPPLRALELVPGQQASLAVQWGTGCADRSRPLSLILALAQDGQVTIPLRLAVRGGRAAPVRCSTPAAPSRLLVSPFRPAYDPGIIDLLAFYRLINAHQVVAAYRETTEHHMSAARFGAGYAQTRSLAIDLLAVPAYRVAAAGARFACVGIRLTAYDRTRAAQGYGGWMMTEVRGGKVGWVVLEGSHLRPGGTAVIPTRAACAAAIPSSLRE